MSNRKDVTRAVAVLLFLVLLLAPASAFSTQVEPITKVQFRSGPCLLPCQTYSVSFDRSGCANYSGYSNVPLIGKFVSIVDFERLASILVMLKVDSLGAHYPMTPGSYDGPNYELRISRGSKDLIVKVLDTDSVPNNLYAISSVIEGFTFSAKWQRASNVGSSAPCKS